MKIVESASSYKQKTKALKSKEKRISASASAVLVTTSDGRVPLLMCCWPEYLGKRNTCSFSNYRIWYSCRRTGYFKDKTCHSTFDNFEQEEVK
jgi:hypothetical protein